MSVTSADRRRQSVLLAAFSVVAFLTSTSPLSLTPFLLSIAADLGSDLAAVSVLFTVMNVSWALAALTTGHLSDRFGRKPLILLGLLLIGVGGLGSALAADYQTLMLARFLVGIGGGCQMSTLFAAAVDLFPATSRGKALGWIMTGQSLSLVAGTPLSALLGSFADWRLPTALLGVASLIALAALARLIPSPPRASVALGPREPGVSLLLRDPRVLTLFGAVLFERMSYSTVVLFFATYLLAVYQLSFHWLAVALVIVAFGNAGGNLLGGRLSDHLRDPHRLVAASMAGNGLLALPLLAAAPGVLISIGLGLLFNLTNAFTRALLIWLATGLSREARGAVMGISLTISASGWLIVSALGGWLITSYGFGSLGLLGLVCGFASAALASLSGLLGDRVPNRSAGVGGVASSS
jgi:DHA1 family inner membrane transport protein